MWHERPRSLQALNFVAALVSPAFAANFPQCREHIENLLTRNNTIDLDTNSTILANHFGFDPIYHGDLYGFDPSAESRPLTITLEGCRFICGSSADLSGVMDAFQILTTWVLPAVALFSSLPYEALGRDKGKNVEAFFNWFGSPAATLSTTMHNIYLIRKCTVLSHAPIEHELVQCVKDAYYVLSSINQYEFPSAGRTNPREWRIRNTALLHGTLWPLLRRGDGTGEISERKWQQLKHLTSNLAFQLRIQRRKAVWPLGISVLWFVIAFAISVVIAFADLGDNTKAHSLALGLLLVWLPVVVVMAIVDRNPASATRCSNLIERWLYNVDAVVNSPPDTMPNLWNRNSKTSLFGIGDFVGQGRRLRYCGVANAVLSKIENPERAQFLLSNLQADSNFEGVLKRRPGSWWVTWILSQLIVAVAFSMAFMVSFNTPTIGLGCRSLLYLIWYLLRLTSWMILGLRQEPPPWLRRVSWIPNTCAALSLFLIMGLQLTNGLNGCLCKSSIFGSKAYGGYTDFENGAFYNTAYHVQKFWGPAAAFGFVDCILPIAWAVHRWTKSDSLWKTSEKTLPADAEGMELDWLM